ncbi:MAG: hypothetical protein WBM09_03815 [Gallionella sp.]
MAAIVLSCLLIGGCPAGSVPVEGITASGTNGCSVGFLLHAVREKMTNAEMIAMFLILIPCLKLWFANTTQ